MATEFLIPNVGDNVNKVTIVSWLVNDGTQIEANQEILEAETDKATVTIPAPTGGYVHLGPYKVGEAVPVGTMVAVIGTAEESFKNYKPNGAASVEATLAVTAPAVAVAPMTVAVESDLRATPVARKVAADLGVDLHTVTGTGEHGRVTKADVLRLSDVPTPLVPDLQGFKNLAGVTSPQIVTPAPDLQGFKNLAGLVPPPPISTPTPVPMPSADVRERVPLKGIRQIIAQRMGESVHTTARVTLIREVDATDLVVWREGLKKQFGESWGFAPGYNELLAMICSNALREFPYMNARLSADGEAIEYLTHVNVGVAVDTNRGLLVTVMRDADKKGLKELGTEFRELVARVRSAKSAPSELTGGTFTITNLGMFNVDAFTPVINLPELAILGVGRIVPKPVVKDGQIVVRHMWTLSLVFDHRLVDGAPAAKFLNHLCELIEDPQLLFLTKR